MKQFPVRETESIVLLEELIFLSPLTTVVVAWSSGLEVRAVVEGLVLSSVDFERREIGLSIFVSSLASLGATHRTAFSIASGGSESGGIRSGSRGMRIVSIVAVVFTSSLRRSNFLLVVFSSGIVRFCSDSGGTEVVFRSLVLCVFAMLTASLERKIEN